MCAHAYRHRYIWGIHACVCIWGTENKLGCCSSGAIGLWFFGDRSLHGVSCLASKLWWVTDFCFFSAGVSSAAHHTQHFHICAVLGLEFRSSCLHVKHFPLAISPVPYCISHDTIILNSKVLWDNQKWEALRAEVSCQSCAPRVQGSRNLSSSSESPDRRFAADTSVSTSDDGTSAVHDRI